MSTDKVSETSKKTSSKKNSQMSQSLKQSENDQSGNEEQSKHSSNNKSNNTNDNISNNKSMNMSQALSENKQYLDTSQGRREQLNKIELRQIQANAFENYINDTGISSAFQLIFSELITKKIPVENYYTYTASRLREIGRELDEIKALRKKNNN